MGCVIPAGLRQQWAGSGGDGEPELLVQEETLTFCWVLRCEPFLATPPSTTVAAGVAACISQHLAKVMSALPQLARHCPPLSTMRTVWQSAPDVIHLNLTKI